MRASRRTGFQALLALVRGGNCWIKISGANRVSETDLPPYDDVKPMAEALIEAAPGRIMWGTDWPHPNKYEVNPNDGDLVDAFGDWVGGRGDAARRDGRHAGGVLPVLRGLRAQAVSSSPASSRESPVSAAAATTSGCQCTLPASGPPISVSSVPVPSPT